MTSLRFCLSSLTSALLLAACTIEQQGVHTEAQFHEPFTYPIWEARSLAGNAGQDACAVTSGHNGYSVVVRHVGGQKVVSVQSERYMPGGAVNILTVNGHRYETTERYFSAKDAPAIAQDFTEAERAYAEWVEIGAHNGKNRYTAIFKLGGFKKAFAQCMK